MSEIKLINKDTILPKLTPFDWDLVIHGNLYYAVKIPGYIHTIGGRWGDNDIWAYPRDEEPSYKNLVEFDAESPVCWGIVYQPILYMEYKWGEDSIVSGQKLQITRNGEPFYDFIFGTIAKVFYLLDRIKEHPLELDTIDFDKKAIGRKVWWRSEPAVIIDYINGQACVILEPDGIDEFTVPSEFMDKEADCYEERWVKTSIFDEHIWWFRD